MSPSKKEDLTSAYYYGENAQEYANSNWMARNQIKTSERILQLLEDSNIGGNLELDPEYQLILDLGCGTGFSSVLFEDHNFNMVGIDLSFDMLLKNLEQQKIIEDNEQIIKIPRNIICAESSVYPFAPIFFITSLASQLLISFWRILVIKRQSNNYYTILLRIWL